MKEPTQPPMLDKEPQMLKLYVDSTIRIRSSVSKISEKIHSTDESGFAAAEQIALAVAGVLIVGGAYIFFSNQIGGQNGGGFLDKVTNTFSQIG